MRSAALANRWSTLAAQCGAAAAGSLLHRTPSGRCHEARRLMCEWRAAGRDRNMTPAVSPALQRRAAAAKHAALEGAAGAAQDEKRHALARTHRHPDTIDARRAAA